jgi:hypothetical protein
MNKSEDDCQPPRESGCSRRPVQGCEIRIDCVWYDYCRGERQEGPAPSDECEPGRPNECGKPCGNPNRPGRPAGKETGRLDDGTPLTKGDLTSPNPPGVWVGPRKDMYLPYLFMRANPGDLGKRPVVGPFWESPDILVLAGIEPALAPAVPPRLGETALANNPNTIYAHVWNFGNCAAAEVIVEFYWCDPSLGINPASTHLIAQTATALGAKGSGRAHRVVKCPEAWTPTFLNGGHECLLVRVWDNTSDLPGEPKLDASINRHIAQRNIHVIASGAAEMRMMNLSPVHEPLVPLATPLILKVGPLYGAPAQINVERVVPHNVPWLQLRTGERGKFPAAAIPTGAPTLSRPVASGGGFPIGGTGTEQHVKGDDQQVALTTSDEAPGRGEAHVYRVSANQGGVVFGGYTVVILGA